VAFDPASRNRLTLHDLRRFAGATLFDRIARAVCRAESVPRKELFESWEVARRTRRRFRGGRVVDLACGHALLAHLMLILDDSSESAVAVDTHIAPSAEALSAALIAEWPRLAGRVQIVEADLATVALHATDVVVSAHACGALTDEILTRATTVRARVAVLPCCHDTAHSDLGGLDGWLDSALAIDVTRAARVRALGYAVHTQTIPAEITPKNRLLLSTPAPSFRVAQHAQVAR